MKNSYELRHRKNLLFKYDKTKVLISYGLAARLISTIVVATYQIVLQLIPLLPENASLKPSSVAVQAGLCRTWSETAALGTTLNNHNFNGN